MKFAKTLLPVGLVLLLCAAGAAVMLQTAAPAPGIPAAQETDREIYLFTQGWKGDALSARAVVIPAPEDPAFAAFAALQEMQQLPLARHAGERGMCYTYALRQSDLHAMLLTADGELIGAACYDPETGEIYEISTR